ncbi:MAG: thiamine pyrophosphate-dependent enzyme [Candidatus Micrarchaeaceae archaeon]
MAEIVNNNADVKPQQKQIYTSKNKPIWCPGCGDFGVFASISKALTELNIEKRNVAIISGIGCSSAMPHSFSTYGVHSLHGRLLPVASGIKLANSELTVIGTGGDGDGYGIGGGHLLHTSRRNIDMTYIIMDNETYGLTTGQTSPTALLGHKTKSTPFGVIEMPINPIAFAISAGATYVARGFSGDPTHLSQLIKGGIEHKGFAIIDVFSPCVTFNHDNTFDWFRPRIYKLESEGHDPSNHSKAVEKAFEDVYTNYEKIPIGLFYKTNRPTYEDLELALKNGPLVKQSMPTKEQIKAIMDENL